tara:strand:- start:126 stop:611 length:486 start_codon:yes stop_codon:yes gene_type:complete
MPDHSLSIDVEANQFEEPDEVRIKTTERRCTKGWRMIIETLAFLLGITTLCFIGLFPVNKDDVGVEKYIQYILCIIINTLLSFIRITYNLIACETDTEGVRKCSILMNAVLGFVFVIWLLKLLIEMYIISGSYTSVLILSSVSTYFIINCWNLWRLRYATD